MSTLDNGWKEYKPDIVHEHATKFWQKRVFSNDVGRISLNIYEYDLQLSNHGLNYELDIYIPEELSPIGMSMHIGSYTYLELDWARIEADGISILERLIGPLT